jgi:hypothetical protein
VLEIPAIVMLLLEEIIVADGLCTVQGCDLDGDICIDADDDLFKDDCSECNPGNLCDSVAQQQVI